MGILLLLVTSNGGGRLRRLMPAIAIAGGLALAAGTTALSLRDLLNFDSPSVWRVLGSVVPAGGLAFVLIVAGLYRIDPLKARRIAVVLVAALVVAGAATAVGMVTDTRFSAPWWLVGVNLATRGVHVVLVLAFGGILDRPRGYGAASVCLLATIICTAGYVVQFHDEVQGLGLFWLASINLVGVGSVLLLALVTVEVMTREEAQVAVQGAA